MKLITNNKQLTTKYAGFTLIETLVAVAILMISITGPLAIANKSVATNTYAKDQITSFYLAQDAIEYMRSVRDNSALNRDSDWLAGFKQIGHECLNVECRIDSANNNIDPSNLTDFLRYDPTTGVYSYSYPSGYTQTQFQRKVKVTNPAPGSTNANEALIEVEVIWYTGNLRGDFKVKESMFNIWGA